MIRLYDWPPQRPYLWASFSSNGNAMAETIPAVVGKVTPVRYECGQEDASGQEKNRAHVSALS